MVVKIWLLTATCDMHVQGVMVMCVWSLCMQREIVNSRALFSSHYTKLGCFRFSIPKSGDNKSHYNVTMNASIDISNSQCHSLTHVDLPAC